MTTYAYVTSFTSGGNALTIAAGDAVFIGDTASIAAMGSFGLTGPSGRLTLEGDLFGANSGVYFSGTAANTILVGQSGSLSGNNYGIYESGNSSFVSNAGTIAGFYGIVELGTNVRIYNTGVIHSDSIAVYLGAGTGTSTVENSGTIVGGAYSVYGTSAVEKVTNTGLIVGATSLAGGNDMFDSRGGTVQGFVDLGVGNDTAYGGMGADNIFGGDDLDRLRGKQGDDRLDGGLGNDTMTGGADEDEFQFSTALGATNVDTITDFVHGEDTILLDDLIFGALGPTVDKSEFYIPLFGGHKATKASHHLIYDEDKGTLWYDADGKGGAAAVKFAQLGTSTDHPTNLNYHDFTIV